MKIEKVREKEEENDEENDEERKIFLTDFKRFFYLL